MKSKELWDHIHEERANLIDTWIAISPEQWSTPSLCEGWTVRDVAVHVVSGAELTPVNFFLGLARAGFRFDTFTDRALKENAGAGVAQLIHRMQARTATTNHPPGPVGAMLSEIVVHGSDIRRPLHLHHRYPDAALVEVANSWKDTNFLLGAKRRIAGLALRASDLEWRHGDGPEVTGPMLALILAMTGRRDAHRDLSGEGLAVLASRN